MNVSTKKNDGVSPVIGTILLVAITVVLVAIISAVVMGMAGGIGTGHIVGVQVTDTPEPGTLLVTITGGANAGDLANISVNINGFPGKYYDSTTVKPIVGMPYNFTFPTDDLSSGQLTVSVVGQFTDGTTQSIYTLTIVV